MVAAETDCSMRADASLPGARRGSTIFLLCLVYGMVSIGCSQGDGSSRGDEETPPLEVLAAVDRASATIGDRIRFTLDIEHDANLEIEPIPVISELGGLTVVEMRRDLLRTVRGRSALRDVWILRADRVGSFVIPALEVVGRGEDGARVAELSDELQLEIVSVLPADGSASDIRDLKPLEERQLLPPWAVAVLVTVGLVILWLAWRWWRRRRGGQKPALSPKERAFLELEALRTTDFADLVQLRSYYFRLSEILRRYLEGLLAINFTDMTSEEIRSVLPTVEGFVDQHRARLLRFLDSTDSVKYAARIPQEREIEEVYESALRLVEETGQPAEDSPRAGTEDEEAVTISAGQGVTRSVGGTVSSADQGDSEYAPESTREEFSHPEDGDDDARFRP